MVKVYWVILLVVAAGAECRSESDSNTDGEMSGYPHEDAAMLGHEKSEEFYNDWGKYWEKVKAEQRSQGILGVTHGKIFLDCYLIMRTCVAGL